MVRRMRKFPGALKHRQYQVVAVEGELTAEEKQVMWTYKFYKDKILQIQLEFDNGLCFTIYLDMFCSAMHSTIHRYFCKDNLCYGFELSTSVFCVCVCVLQSRILNSRTLCAEKIP